MRPNLKECFCTLPYGKWTEDDGATVLFDHRYQPLARIRDGAEPERVPPDLRIKYVAQEYFFDARFSFNMKVERFRLQQVAEDFGIAAWCQERAEQYANARRDGRKLARQGLW